MGIITTLFQRPDKKGVTVSANIDLMATYFDFKMMDKIISALVDKAVKEIWKKQGASILRKVDKKTIGNLTVKKLSTLIAKELAAPTTTDLPN